MKDEALLVRADHVAIAADRDYLPALRAAIAGARERLWCTQFVVDGRPAVDVAGDVRYLCHAVAEAASRGVDVRVLLDDLVPDTSPREMNWAALEFLASRGVVVRAHREPFVRKRLLAARYRTLHAKLVVVDDLAIVGNHNWTPGAFADNHELSLVVRGAGPTELVARRFEALWAHGVPHRAPRPPLWGAR